MKFIRRELTPGRVSIGGEEYPILYSFEAVSMMEEELRMPLHEIMPRLMELPDAKGETHPLPFTDQAKVLWCLMRAAGVEADFGDLLASVHMREQGEIGLAILTEILNKSPTGGGKTKKE